MADVVFITPNFMGYAREEPIGTLLLTTILNQAGIPSEILPFHQFGAVNNFENFIQSAIEKVSRMSPKIVSFYTRCDTYHISLKIAQRLKQTFPGIYIVFGGPQSDLVATDTLAAISYVDYICCGEGETTIVPFFSSLIAGKPDHTVRGLTYRENGKIIVNPRPELVADLDTLPMIDWSLFDSEACSSERNVQQGFSVDVGRGCPFSCTFCSTKMFWGQKYRLKSADRIIEEIKEVHEKFGITSFVFEHDMFTLNRNKVIQICGMLKNIGFDISWRCSARIDCLDQELIDIMAEAGLTSLFVGIETGSPRMQKVIHKNLKLDKVVDTLSYIGDKGIRWTASFIFGFPDETEEDFAQTMALMLELGKLPRGHIQHHLCTFFTGTEIAKQYASELVQASSLSDITGEVAVSECEDLILAHPALFSHFFEYKNELREKVKYYPSFFECWLMARPVFEYIAQKYYPDQLCQILYDFSDSNCDLLAKKLNVPELLQHDRFLDRFNHDECYSILKEIFRFIVWKTTSTNAGTELFRFDVAGFMNGKPVDQLSPKFTAVNLQKTSSNGNKLTFYSPK